MRMCGAEAYKRIWVGGEHDDSKKSLWSLSESYKRNLMNVGAPAVEATDNGNAQGRVICGVVWVSFFSHHFRTM